MSSSPVVANGSAVGLQPQKHQQQQQPDDLSGDELIALLQGGVDGGLLGPAHEAALRALAGGQQLNERQLRAAYAAAVNRTDLLDTKLDELDLKVVNLYTSHHSGKVDMLHVKARVIYQVIYSTNDVRLVDCEPGETTRSPIAWKEVQLIMRKKTLKEAKEKAAEILGASVAWRLCVHYVPGFMGKFVTGDFMMDAFQRVARRTISVRLSYSQASGLTQRNARIVLRNNGVVDCAELVREAISASADRVARNRARFQRTHEVVLKMHSDASVQARLARGLGMTEEQVEAAFPEASDYVPLGPELQPLLAPDERAREPTREDPTGLARAGIIAPPPAAATTPDRASAIAAAPQGAVATPPRAAAVAAAMRIAAVVAAAGGATAAAAAPAARHGKRVASAGQRGGAGGGAGGGASGATPPRRQRVARPSGSSEGDVEAAAAELAEPEPVAPAAAGNNSHGIALVSAPAAASAEGVLALSAPSLTAAAAANPTEEAALALPVFKLNTPANSDLVVDYITHVSPSMVEFVLRLLRAAEAGLVMTGDFCYELAVAFDDASLLVDAIDQSGGHALAPNRVFIKRDKRLFGLGLGACFTSFAVSEYSLGGGGGGGSSNSSGSSSSSNNRAIGTTAFVVFVDPEHNDAYNPCAEPHAFELVYGGGLRKQLRHGTVLVSRPGGNPWRVEGVAGADGANHKKLREVCFFASSEVARAVGSSGGGPAGRSAAVHDVIERLMATGAKGRGDALAIFANVVE